MICPVCKRDLAPTLSICLTCGAMMNDSVREELHSKLASGTESVKRDVLPVRRDPAPVQVPKVKRPAVRIDTAELAIKKTSPTLAEFKTQTAAIPDWRLQLQNSVRQRTGGGHAESSHSDAISSPVKVRTSGANALKAEFVEEQAQAEPMNLKVANALKRIEESRRAFLPEVKKKPETHADPKAASKNFPFNVVSRSDELPAKPLGGSLQRSSAVSRPKLVSSLRIEKKKFDTNKLLPIPEAARLASSFETMDEVVDKPRQPLKEDWSKKIEIKETRADAAAVEPELPVVEGAETEDIDDLAPIAMRFNAGLFDLIIGGFGSLTVLSPLLFSTEGWISLSGLLAFAPVFLVVMFVYLTASLSYFSRTFGMKVFSLELVDAEQSEYPTLHQAAVSSSIYLLSLALCGLGFLPMLFNEEKRAAHDIASGTILIREM